MSNLEAILASLSMAQYYSSFVVAGFDTWETLLDITEDDLDSLAVQRGHRRRLQQEIAHSLNTGAEPDVEPSKPLSRSLSNVQGSLSTQPGRKRQYNRHPKPDPNAPQRPLSAYVLFSNAMRDELKENSLSFAEKSKIVGDRWQTMPESVKQRWRQKASEPWDAYKSEQTQYQSSEAHRGYQTYLAEFNTSKPSKKRKLPSKDSLRQAKDAVADPNVKRSSAVDGRSADTVRRLAPAPKQAPLRAQVWTSPQSTKSTRRKRSGSPRRESTSTTPSAQSKSSQWYSHACESCKKKKVKCDGAVPSCERCVKGHVECTYAGGIRDKEKRYQSKYYSYRASS